MANVRAGGRSIEVSGRTVDDAIAKALRELGVSRDKVDVKVLHAGSPGRLLGFGAEPARIRVTLTDGPPAGMGEAGAGIAGIVEAEREAAEAAEVETEVFPEAPELETAATGGEAELARMMLSELLGRMGFQGMRVEVVDHDPITLNIRGDDVAELIGRRGENLRALQFVLSLMLNKQLHRHLRIAVDADGYRARREQLLRSMATRFAHRVRMTREPMPLEAMAPNERRIIHLALADDPDVITESVGEGDARRVVIKPRR